jgi:mRNA-degrading endonuclease RelE of RelBE toxin-antitoxin system
LLLTPRARKQLADAERRKRERIDRVIMALAENPRSGDVHQVQGSGILRKRAGDWRIFFKILPRERMAVVGSIERRGSTTC